MAKNSTINIERLMRLEPLSALSNERLDELAKLAYIERVSIGVSLFREGDLDNQTLYLLQGDVQLSSSDGSFDEVVTSRHNTAKFPLDDSQPRQVSCVALGLVEFLRIDNSVLDYMMMWDQLAVQEELFDGGESKKQNESELTHSHEASAEETLTSDEVTAKEDQPEEGQSEEDQAKQATTESTSKGNKASTNDDSDSSKKDDEIVEENKITPGDDNKDSSELLETESKAEPKIELQTESADEKPDAQGQDKEQKSEKMNRAEEEKNTQATVTTTPASNLETEATQENANKENKTVVKKQFNPDATVVATVEELHTDYNTADVAEQNNDSDISINHSVSAPMEKGAWMRRMRHIMAFKNLPPANIKTLLEKMESIEVSKGDTIVQQGEIGDTFYVITDGEAKVTRTIELAELKAGASFGEESLVSGGERNASITMSTDGVLMKLSKQDFDLLLKEPMLNRISPEDARIAAYKDHHWLDVRHASEYQHSHLRKAMNIPLHEIRMRMSELDKNKNYICYCNTGRRSSAAAFILAQAGYRVNVLNGGVRVMPQDLVKE